MSNTTLLTRTASWAKSAPSRRRASAMGAAAWGRTGTGRRPRPTEARQPHGRRPDPRTGGRPTGGVLTHAGAAVTRTAPYLAGGVTRVVRRAAALRVTNRRDFCGGVATSMLHQRRLRFRLRSRNRYDFAAAAPFEPLERPCGEQRDRGMRHLVQRAADHRIPVPGPREGAVRRLEAGVEQGCSLRVAQRGEGRGRWLISRRDRPEHVVKELAQQRRLPEGAGGCPPIGRRVPGQRRTPPVAGRSPTIAGPLDDGVDVRRTSPSGVSPRVLRKSSATLPATGRNSRPAASVTTVATIAGGRTVAICVYGVTDKGANTGNTGGSDVAFDGGPAGALRIDLRLRHEREPAHRSGPAHRCGPGHDRHGRRAARHGVRLRGGTGHGPAGHALRRPARQATPDRAAGDPRRIIAGRRRQRPATRCSSRHGS